MRFLNSFGVDLVDTSGNITPDVFGGLLALTILFLMLTVYFFKQNRKNKLELENLKYLEKHKNEILEALKKVKIDITYNTTWEIIVIKIETIINLYIEESSKNNQFKEENENLQFQVRRLKERVKQLEFNDSNKNNNNEAKTIKDKDKLIEDKDKLIKNKDKLIEDKDKLIEDKDKLIEDKDKLIEDKDKLIEDKDKLIEDKDKQLKLLPGLKKQLENSQLLQDERLETIEIQKQEISSLEETIEIQKQEISSLEETIMNPIQEISSLEEAIMNPIQEISSLEETIKNYNQKLSRLKKNIKNYNQKLINLKENYTYYTRVYKEDWDNLCEKKRLCKKVKYLRKQLRCRIMLRPIKEETVDN
jgi:chromosome segregation ATPase